MTASVYAPDNQFQIPTLPVPNLYKQNQKNKLKWTTDIVTVFFPIESMKNKHHLDQFVASCLFKFLLNFDGISVMCCITLQAVLSYSCQDDM